MSYYCVSEFGAGSSYPEPQVLPPSSSYDGRVLTVSSTQARNARASSTEPRRHLLVGFRMRMLQPNTYVRLPSFAEAFGKKSSHATMDHVLRESTPFVELDSNIESSSSPEYNRTERSSESMCCVRDESMDLDYSIESSSSAEYSGTKRSPDTMDCVRNESTPYVDLDSSIESSSSEEYTGTKRISETMECPRTSTPFADLASSMESSSPECYEKEISPIPLDCRKVSTPCMDFDSSIESSKNNGWLSDPDESFEELMFFTEKAELSQQCDHVPMGDCLSQYLRDHVSTFH